MSLCCIILAVWGALAAMGLAFMFGATRKTPEEQAADDAAQAEYLRAWRRERELKAHGLRRMPKDVL